MNESTITVIRTTMRIAVGTIAAFGLACSLSVFLWTWLSCLLAAFLTVLFREELTVIADRATDYTVDGIAWAIVQYRRAKAKADATV